MNRLVPDAGRLPEHAASVREGFTLPPGRTEAEAIAQAVQYRKKLWRIGGLTDDQKIMELRRLCTGLCLGDAESGGRLASRTFYS